MSIIKGKLVIKAISKEFLKLEEPLNNRHIRFSAIAENAILKIGVTNAEMRVKYDI